MSISQKSLKQWKQIWVDACDDQACMKFSRHNLIKPNPVPTSVAFTVREKGWDYQMSLKGPCVKGCVFSVIFLWGGHWNILRGEGVKEVLSHRSLPWKEVFWAIVSSRLTAWLQGEQCCFSHSLPYDILSHQSLKANTETPKYRSILDIWNSKYLKLQNTGARGNFFFL